METSILEKPQTFVVLRLVANNPGSTAYAIAEDPEKGRDRTREVRLAELTEVGLLEAREALYKGRTVKRYYLTDRGESFMCILALIEKL